MFNKKINTSSREEMVKYLKNHYRYNTMNGWNNSTSYANNMKIYNLGLKYPDMAYELLNISEVSDDIYTLIGDWADEQGNRYRAGFNGRSDGYLVMYQSEVTPSGYKSYCTKCGQLNCKTIEITNRCGRCGADARVNFSKPHMQVKVYPGRSIDQNEDFTEWDMESLRGRVRLVQSFDQLCDDIVAMVENYCANYQVVEKEVCVPKKIKVLQAV